MRGREQFRRWRVALLMAWRISGFIPTGVCHLAMAAVRNLPGSVGFAARYVLLRRLSRSCGDVVAVYPGVYVKNPSRLTVGDRVSLHEMCYLECAGGLEIGSDVSIAHSSSIVTHEHGYTLATTVIRDAPLWLQPVAIQDNVWIGAGVRVLAGVTIGSGAVVGANAVVTKDIAPNAVAVGVPARPMASRV
jgi:acetyltransferase-like isoleucine patch superfamily enzyme